jgi:hypothetical protein
MNVRVHKYDVEAFTWETRSTLSVRGIVESQKAVFYQGKYYFFYRNTGGENYVQISNDGDSWSENEIKTGNAAWDPDWRTLTSMFQDQTLAVLTAEGLYVCNDLKNADGISFSLSGATLPEGSKLVTPLFTLGDHFWVIASRENSNYLYALSKDSTKYQEKTVLPAGLAVKEITPFVAPSGSITTLGYIFGGKDANGKGTVWAIDKNGGIGMLTNGQSSFPATYPMPIFFGNKLCIAGGKTGSSYTRQFYDSSDSGISWSNDWHKDLPEEIGPVAAGSIFEYERNKIILIGGETGGNEQNFQPKVWKGTLNQELLDNSINN